jgi:LacI family transcriptional regulator
MVHGFRDIDLPVSIFDVEAPHHRADHFAMLASSYRPEGAVVVSLQPDSQQLELLSSAGLCPVFIDTEVERFSSVNINNHRGGLMATRHLVGLGHERIAFVGDAEGLGFGFNSSTARRLGYRAALAGAGLLPHPGFERTGEHGRDTGRRLAEELFALPDAPTAVFAGSDTQALGVMEAAQEAGLRVPEDVSVIGFDDIESARYLGLTTVRQPLYESGLAAARLVIDQLADPECAPTRIELDLEVIVRKSTAPPSS